MGAGHKPLPICPSLSKRCPAPGLPFGYAPACGLKLKSFQTDVPRASETQCVFVSSGIWSVPVLQKKKKKVCSRVEGCVISSCRGKQVFNISGRTETRELWGWWQLGLSLLQGMFQGHFLLMLSLPAPTSSPLLSLPWAPCWLLAGCAILMLQSASLRIDPMWWLPCW